MCRASILGVRGLLLKARVFVVSFALEKLELGCFQEQCGTSLNFLKGAVKIAAVPGILFLPLSSKPQRNLL